MTTCKTMNWNRKLMGPDRQTASSASPTSPCCQGTLRLLGAMDNGYCSSPCVLKESQREKATFLEGQ